MTSFTIMIINEPILQSIPRRKLKWYFHTIIHDDLSKIISKVWLMVIENVVDPK